MRKSLLMLGILWGVFIVSVCSKALADDEPQMTSVILQLKWQHAFQFAGYYAAKAQGYYQQEGLDVQLVEGHPGVDTVQEVVSGRADFGVGTTELLLNRQQGAPVTVLGVVYQHSPLQLAVLEDSGIHTPKDLINKRVMLEQKASPEIRALLTLELSNAPDIFGFLKRAGVAHERYQSVEHSHTLAHLLSKEVDAISIYVTNQPFELNELNVSYRVLNPVMSGIDFYGDNLFTTDYLIHSNPKLVNRFYRASMKGWRYALDHPTEIIDLIYQQYSQRMSMSHLRYEAQVTAQLMQANLIQPGYMNLDRWNHIVDVYQRLGDLPEDFHVENMLYQESEVHIKTLTQQLLWLFVGFVFTSVLGLILWYFYRQAQSNWYRLTMLLTHVPSAVIVVDAKGVIQLWNKGAEHIFGWTEKEAVHENVLSLLVPKSNQLVITALLDRVRHGQVVEYSKNANIHKDGHGLVCEWVNTPYRDEQNQQDYILCMAHDATKTDTWMELVRAKDDAEQATHAKIAFIMNVGRTLMQPFKKILQDVQSINTEQAINASKGISSGCQLMNIQEVAQRGLLLTQQIIDLSRLESGDLMLQTELFSVRAVMDMLALKFSQQCVRHHLAFVYDYQESAPHVMTADAERLNQVLEVLLNNAIQFTREGEVVFRVSAQENQLCFEVIDTGIGMDNATQRQLFQSLSRSSHDSYQGAGLSLLLSKSVISAMGGILDFESRLGKGSKFWVKMPISTSISE